MATTTQRDYYEVLGVAHDADDKTIKKAFRRLALRYHPDRSKEPDAEARFKEIAEAYAVLSDPRKRAEYDARGFAGVAGFTPEDLFAGIDFGDLFGPMGFGPGGGLFERLFHPHARRGRTRGGDIEVGLTIPLSTVLTGGQETVVIPRPGPCKACSGTGARSGTQPLKCEACGGSGQQASTSRRGNVLFQQITTCPSCAGRGTTIENPCPQCGGTGEVIRRDRVKVQVPAGIDEGTALRIPGHGMPSREPRGEPGDAFVVVETLVDPRFVRRGPDLFHAEVIDVVDAVLGTTLQIPTLDGDVPVRVDPGTQAGTTLRVAGEGLPRVGGGRRGDMYVTLAVRIPEHVSQAERQLWEQLRRTASASPTAVFSDAT
jgi:molecular chaperone DnaJ